MRSRGMRRFAMVLAGLVVVGVAGCGALWYRLSSGPITLDFATDWLAAAIKENLGDRYQVEVGGTVLSVTRTVARRCASAISWYATATAAWLPMRRAPRWDSRA